MELVRIRKLPASGKDRESKIVGKVPPIQRRDAGLVATKKAYRLGNGHTVSIQDTPNGESRLDRTVLETIPK